MCRVGRYTIGWSKLAGDDDDGDDDHDNDDNGMIRVCLLVWCLSAGRAGVIVQEYCQLLDTESFCQNNMLWTMYVCL